jgi:hypothetical protein
MEQRSGFLDMATKFGCTIPPNPPLGCTLMNPTALPNPEWEQRVLSV